MSIQQSFNDHAINLFPKVKEAIKGADNFDANQMYCKTLNWIKTSIKRVNDMCQEEKDSFETALISVFIDKNWLK